MKRDVVRSSSSVEFASGRFLLGLCAIVVGPMACHFHEHVRLTAPAHDAPVTTRVEAYRELAPQGSYVRTEVVGVSLLGHVDTKQHEGLRLMNGAEIECPLDLVPLVEADSFTAIEAREWDEHNLLGDLFGWAVALPLGVASFGAMMGGSASGDDTLTTLGGVGLVLGLSVAIVTMVFHGMASDHKRRALSLGSYRAALRERLRLCPAGAEHGVCRD